MGAGTGDNKTARERKLLENWNFLETYRVATTKHGILFVCFTLRSFEGAIIVRRFSSWDVALSEARAKQKPGLPAYRPLGIRYDSCDAIDKVMSPAVGEGDMPVGGSIPKLLKWANPTNQVCWATVKKAEVSHGTSSFFHNLEKNEGAQGWSSGFSLSFGTAWSRYAQRHAADRFLRCAFRCAIAHLRNPTNLG
jgi:hypothetical protein